MNNLTIEKTKDKLGIICDVNTGNIEMVGNSYPENAVGFFSVIYNWIREYMKEENRNITINFKIDYFNTSTSKCLIELFEILKEYHDNNGEVKVNWYFRTDDEDIKETGEELLEDYEFAYEILEY